MIRRDWNHPSIVLWGVRINESADNHDFYTRTNALAHSLDDSRQTGGIRNQYDSELLEDVFTMNDFGFPLRPPNHPAYLNTEFNGHMFSTKRFDNVEHVAEHVIRHVRVHDQLAGDDRYAGGIAWCAFDYATHRCFGSGDRICYHGVSDIFRLPKPAAGFYRSQCDPQEEVVIEPGFFYSWGDRGSGNGPGVVPICSNCDHLKIYYNGRLLLEADADRKTYANLKYPPFIVSLTNLTFDQWGDLKIEGLYPRQAGGHQDAIRQRPRRPPGGETRRCGAGWRWPRRYPCGAGGDGRVRQYPPIRHRRDSIEPHRPGRNRGREPVLVERGRGRRVGEDQGGRRRHQAGSAPPVPGQADGGNSRAARRAGVRLTGNAVPAASACQPKS